MANSSSGYKYDYLFWMDDDTIPDRPRQRNESHGDKVILFWDFRTNFTLKLQRPITAIDRDDQDDTTIEMGSESRKLSTGGDVHHFQTTHTRKGAEFLEEKTGERLKEYSVIPDDVIARLADEAFDSAVQKTADPHNRSLLMIRVVVGLDVCTVQREGEPLDEVMDRAIRPGRLRSCDGWTTDTDVDEELWCFLKDDLARVRVEDVDKGLRVMESCSICFNGPVIGSEISLLSSCGHASHFHCARLMENNSCPSCCQKVHGYISDSDCDSDFGSDSGSGFDSDSVSDLSSSSDSDSCSDSESVSDSYSDSDCGSCLCCQLACDLISGNGASTSTQL